MSDDLRDWLEYGRELGLVAVKREAAPPRRAHPAPPAPAVVPSGGAADGLAGIRAEIGDCQRCRLAQTRTHIVFGAGSPRAEIMFVGEAPGADEDAQGLPFVGRAGQLLTKMIEAMKLRREDVYIANIIKCRPPENRPPEEDEVAACSGFLRQQVETIRPRVVIALGGTAAQTLLGTTTPIGKLRGRFHDFHGVPLLPTFHPSYLLRSPRYKKETWEDLQRVMEFLGTRPE